MARKLYIKTFGCQMNEYDSAKMHDVLADSTEIEQVATPEEARSMVRELHDQGVNFIKVYEMTRPEVFAALVETANELNLPIDSHVPLSMRARVAASSAVWVMRCSSAGSRTTPHRQQGPC